MNIMLYDRERSGHCHRVRLLLSFLGLKYDKVEIPRQGGGPNKAPPEFFKMNPRALVPLLVVDGKPIWDSTAILVYLARRYGGEKWLPTDPDGMAEVMQWLALAQNEILYGLALARAHRGNRLPAWRGEVRLVDLQNIGIVGLKALESRLKDAEWLALDGPTIGDLACFPYVALAPEGGISLRPYPGVVRWIERIKQLPGYVPLPVYDGSGGPLAD
jgi:glutathione S-transferase